MIAARLHAVGDLRVGAEPDPGDPPPGWSLVAVTSVGICGSDLHWFTDGGIGDNRIEHPVVPGHEFAAVAVTGPHAGRRVAVDPAIPCESLRDVPGGPSESLSHGSIRRARHVGRRHAGTAAVARPSAVPAARRDQRRRRRPARAAWRRDPCSGARSPTAGMRRAGGWRRACRGARVAGRTPVGGGPGLRRGTARASQGDGAARRCRRGLCARACPGRGARGDRRPGCRRRDRDGGYRRCDRDRR